MGETTESVSPRTRRAVEELRAWREQMTDPKDIAAADRVIALLLREGDRLLT